MSKLFTASTEYQKYFQEKLDKYNVDSPEQLEGEEKKKFFEEVDAGWKSEKEARKKEASVARGLLKLAKAILEEDD